MNHIGDRADAVERVEGVERLRAVRHADRHAVALADAGGEQRLCREIDPCEKLRVGRKLAHELVGIVFRKFQTRRADHLIDGFAGVVQVRRGISVEREPGCAGGNTHIVSDLSFLPGNAATIIIVRGDAVKWISVYFRPEMR